eukprot:501273-Alexandrium_andersonii.AAC.1
MVEVRKMPENDEERKILESKIAKADKAVAQMSSGVQAALATYKSVAVQLLTAKVTEATQRIEELTGDVAQIRRICTKP